MSDATQNLRTRWGKDFMASVVVFLVALPLCMGWPSLQAFPQRWASSPASSAGSSWAHWLDLRFRSAARRQALPSWFGSW